MSTLTLVLLSILVVLVLGFVLKQNYGLLGIAFAFICGCLLMGLPANTVIAMWPTRVFFQMFSMAFFYAMAINNGTMELLARKIIYVSRNTTFLIPVILYVICAVFAGIGPGTIASFLVIVPIIMQVAKRTKMSYYFAVMIAVGGINTGGWSPISINGMTLNGLMVTAGYTLDEAAQYVLVLFRNFAIVAFLIFVIGYVIFRGWKCAVADTEQPDKFNKQQRTTVALIAILTALLVLPPLCNTLFGGEFFGWLAARNETTFLAIIFGIILIILKAGDETKAISSVAWKTIIMVCGMSMLVEVASRAGAIDVLSGFLERSFSERSMPMIIALISGVMSVFASAMGVVVPTIYPIIRAVCESTGASPALLFSVVPIAAALSGISPVSLTGGLVMSYLEEHERRKMFIALLIFAIGFLALCILFIAIGIIRN